MDYPSKAREKDRFHTKRNGRSRPFAEDKVYFRLVAIMDVRLFRRQADAFDFNDS